MGFEYAISIATAENLHSVYTFVEYINDLNPVHTSNNVEVTGTGADPGVEIGGGHMASAKRKPITGVWGLCPQRGPGAEPLVRRSGGKAP